MDQVTYNVHRVINGPFECEDGHWWSENLYFTSPDDTVHVKGEHFYKARWNVRVK